MVLASDVLLRRKGALKPAEDAVEVFQTPDMGFGVRARQRFCQGAVLWEETPLMALQHRYSRRCTMSCYHCFRALGDLRSSIERLLGLGSYSLASDFPAVNSLLLKLEDPDFALKPPLPCSGGCGAMFCSRECEIAAGRSAHGVICSLRGPDREAWEAFEEHAAQHNESFVLAGCVCAAVVAEVARGVPLKEAKAMFWRFPNEQTPWPLLVDYSRNFYDSATLQRWRSRREVILLESLVHLRRALSGHVERLGVDIEELLSQDQFALLAGQLDLTNIWLSYSNPLTERLDKLMSAKQLDVKWQQLIKEVRQAGLLKVLARTAIKTQIQEETLQVANCPQDEEKGVRSTAPKEHEAPTFPTVDGMGFYATLCMMNHSCQPNIELQYRHDCHVASLVATRNLEAGEELTIAYLGDIEDRSFVERQDHLFVGYGFICCCESCVADASEVRAEHKSGQKRKVSEAELDAASLVQHLAKSRVLQDCVDERI